MPKFTRTPEGDLVPDDDHIIDLTGEHNQFRDGLRAYLSGQQPSKQEVRTCDVCGHKNDVEPWSVGYFWRDGRMLCSEHRDEALAEFKRKKLADECSKILADADGWVTRRLAACGMRPIELQASMGEIPVKLARILHSQAPEATSELRAGRYPRKGFGLVGVARIGKTMALAALLRKCLTVYLMRKAPLVGFEVEVNGFLFVHWPSVCAKWRLEWDKDDSWVKTKLVNDLCTKPCVLIDDIAREGRSKDRSYSEDPSTLLLNKIVDDRHAHGLTTLWTSNLLPEALETFYGSAFYERLAQLAPPIVIEGVTPITGGPHPIVG
jgi:hypothetical protein